MDPKQMSLDGFADVANVSAEEKIAKEEARKREQAAALKAKQQPPETGSPENTPEKVIAFIQPAVTLLESLAVKDNKQFKTAQNRLSWGLMYYISYQNPYDPVGYPDGSRPKVNMMSLQLRNDGLVTLTRYDEYAPLPPGKHAGEGLHAYASKDVKTLQEIGNEIARWVGAVAPDRIDEIRKTTGNAPTKVAANPSKLNKFEW